ncbi:GNAT family N-acetyltransferase [Paenisporosarcina cavernae]|uniref:GNAT family N-acetyltransferase n=1 Tax=Paenisporosarcina cavernae TaxID=2320858 RepID=A0A385YS71_9BACL|nr:GNAT family N-acetyltransferase [Paenisporosarcina cavernae]AYC28562.1 GNAT family N-acetyltransferase [Paenisporosarcina cavernae]
MYRKEQYVFLGNEPVKAIVRNYQKEDFSELMRVQRESFPPPFRQDLLWSEEQLESHLATYPEGSFCVEIEGEVVGSITGMKINFDSNSVSHSWEEVTNQGYIVSHDPDGDTLYVVDICVRPAYRKLDVGKMLLHAMYERVVYEGMTRVLGGGRMPGYSQYAEQATPEEYVERVVAGVWRDPVITFMLRCGRSPVAIVTNYLEDEASHNFGLLMEWRNPFITTT